MAHVLLDQITDQSNIHKLEVCQVVKEFKAGGVYLRSLRESKNQN